MYNNDVYFFHQNSGFTIVAEKLNFYRYLSHFRAVHRGAFFTEMRTTSVRKLLPEAWGEWGMGGGGGMWEKRERRRKGEKGGEEEGG